MMWLALLIPKVYCVGPHGALFHYKEEVKMVKKLLALVFVSVLAFPALLVQAAPAQDKMDKKAKQDRWEGVIIRSSSDKSTLTVRKVGSSVEKIVQYDSSTKWVSQEHGSKKVNDIDSTQVKDGDRVICEGSWDKDGVLHATLISKRLSHPGA
jgi:esterase/lipase superfamily enzyme